MKEFINTMWLMAKVAVAFICVLIGLAFIIPGYVLIEFGKSLGRFYDSIMKSMRRNNGPEFIREAVDM